MSTMVPTTTLARVDIVVQNNQTWQDAFQFGVVGDTTWSFTGQHFRADIKADKFTTTPLLTVSDALGTIVVDDVIQRVLHFNVTEALFSNAGIVPGDYVFDLVMFDNGNPAVRIPLMGGKFKMKLGITGG